MLHKKLQVVKPHLWPRIEILSSGGHESRCNTWLAAATFQMDKEAVVHIYNGILLSHNIWVSSNEEDEPRTCYTEWSLKEKNKYHILMYKWNLERWYWWTFLEGNKGDADIENRLVGTVGEGDGGMNWESSETSTVKLMFIF